VVFADPELLVELELLEDVELLEELELLLDEPDASVSELELPPPPQPVRAKTDKRKIMIKRTHMGCSSRTTD